MEELYSPETGAANPDSTETRDMRETSDIHSPSEIRTDRYLDVHVEQPDEATPPGAMLERMQDDAGGSVFSPSNRHHERPELNAGE